jgi:hypothetical protein
MWLIDADFRDLSMQAGLRIEFSQDQTKWPVDKFIPLYMFVVQPN